MKVQRKAVFWGLLFWILLALGGSVQADEGGYTITDYDVKAILHTDNTIDVTERIGVYFTEERHGIYRNIPMEMTVVRDISKKQDKSEEKIFRYGNKIRNIQVKGDEFTASRQGEDEVIKIGSEDEAVIGAKTYVLTYTYVMPDDRIPYSDFLYYSILGSETEVPINRFTFRLTFEKPLTDASLEAFLIYSGDPGEKKNMLKVSYELNEYGVSGQAENIGENQAVTVFTNLPRGYFKNAFKHFSRFSGDDVCADSHFVCSLSDLIPDFSESCEVRPGGLLSAGGDGQRQSRGNLSRRRAFYGPAFSDPLLGPAGLCGDSWPEEEKDGGDPSREKKELPESAPAYQKTMFEALFRDGAEEVYTQKLPEGFEKYLRKALKELEKEF